MALIKFVVNKIKPKFRSFLFAFFMKTIPLFLDSSLLCWKFLLHKASRVQKNTRFLTIFGVLADTRSSSKLKLTLNLFEIQVTQTLDLSNLSLVPTSNSLFSLSPLFKTRSKWSTNSESLFSFNIGDNITQSNHSKVIDLNGTSLAFFFLF